MSNKNVTDGDIQTQKWIKDGRGQGHGAAYKPWITVRDIASQGRSHRVFGHTTQRTHHLLSDLELAVFFLLEWQQSTIDIREQFPLRLDQTKDIAESCGIRHPEIRGVSNVMSSDFLVNTNNHLKPKFVLQAKYTVDLDKPRTVEKLEIERLYWLKKGIPWYLITENDIPKTVTKNINWLYPAQRNEIDAIDLFERANFYNHIFQSSPNSTIIDISKKLGSTYELPLGQSLLEIRQLLAKRYFIFDIFTPCFSLLATDLVLSKSIDMLGALNVSNK